jgi:hypothetical protein
MTQRVWLVLAEVRVESEDNPANFTIDSEALVQCFLLEPTIELALAATDRLLEAEGMRRIDVRSCRLFDGPQDDEDEDVPNFVKKDILLARESGHARTGTFFATEKGSSFQKDVTIEDATESKWRKQ